MQNLVLLMSWVLTKQTIDTLMNLKFNVVVAVPVLCCLVPVPTRQVQGSPSPLS